MYPPLDHGLRHHFLGPQVTPGNQQLFVGTRPVDGGEVASVIRIDGCATETEAVWLGEQIHADLISHLRFVNQEEVPFEAVTHEHAVPLGGVDWSVAVYVILGSAEQGEAMVAFLTEYAGVAVGMRTD
jgi:hypothetical protein